jgi:YD repeat-containing protein
LINILFFFLSVQIVPAQAANNVTYQYDAIGRITQITRDDGVTIHYSYDPNGNRTQQQVTSTGIALSGTPQTGWWWDTTQTGSGIAIETTPSGVGSVAPYMYDELR